MALELLIPKALDWTTLQVVPGKKGLPVVQSHLNLHYESGSVVVRYTQGKEPVRLFPEASELGTGGTKDGRASGE